MSARFNLITFNSVGKAVTWEELRAQLAWFALTCDLCVACIPDVAASVFCWPLLCRTALCLQWPRNCGKHCAQNHREFPASKQELRRCRCMWSQDSICLKAESFVDLAQPCSETDLLEALRREMVRSHVAPSKPTKSNREPSQGDEMGRAKLRSRRGLNEEQGRSRNA